MTFADEPDVFVIRYPDEASARRAEGRIHVAIRAGLLDVLASAVVLADRAGRAGRADLAPDRPLEPRCTAPDRAGSEYQPSGTPVHRELLKWTAARLTRPAAGLVVILSCPTPLLLAECVRASRCSLLLSSLDFEDERTMNEALS